ncbi:DUF2946 family protein [Luteimonas sp. SDU101]|uniref:DUF2946 family protein n=1 Tax=unclassified Luteimonas TaxID=2629088 RepID=UPI003EBC9DFE
MLLLALAATLLAAAAPALSRFLAAGTGPSSRLVDMCTTAGLKRMAVDIAPDVAPDPVPVLPQPGVDPVCGYCVLPPPLSPVPAPAAAPQAWRAPSPVPPRTPPVPGTWRNVRGLGAQGPPIVS